MVVVTKPENTSVEKKLDLLNDKFQQLKERISKLRKHGKDTSIVEIMLLDYLPYVRMAKATYHLDDIAKIETILEEIAKELDEVEYGSDFELAFELVKEAYEHIRQEELKEASICYNKIIKIYPKLTKDLKKSIYKACLDIKQKLDN